MADDCPRCRRREAAGDALSPARLQAAIALVNEARLSAFITAEHSRKRSRRAYAVTLRNDLASLRTMLTAALHAALADD